jgi:hypothetical protein
LKLRWQSSDSFQFQWHVWLVGECRMYLSLFRPTTLPSSLHCFHSFAHSLFWN